MTMMRLLGVLNRVPAKNHTSQQQPASSVASLYGIGVMDRRDLGAQTGVRVGIGAERRWLIPFVSKSDST